MAPSALTPDQVLEVLADAAEAIERALGGIGDWGEAGTRTGQHHSDLAADAAALEVLRRADLGVLSEESGLHAGGEVVVVLDPLDGSTNASRGIPWYATSLCAVDRDGPLAALVVDLVASTRFEAIRGAGARRDGAPMRPSACDTLGEALVGLSGHPARHLGWRQYRALGAVALDLCAVAGGVLDAYIDCSPSAHGAWDYLAGALICTEAGAAVADAEGRELCVIDHAARRTPVAGAGEALLAEALAARRGLDADLAEPGR
jgi:myo-inositol-1(or 4)-monophosphatase